MVLFSNLLCALLSVWITVLIVFSTRIDGDSSPAPPYPVFPTEFVGEIKNIFPPDSRPPPLEPWNKTWQVAADASTPGQRRIRATLRADNDTATFTYLIFDKVPNPRPGSVAANYTVVIAEDGNMPPQPPYTSPYHCQYSTSIMLDMFLPFGLDSVVGYGDGCGSGSCIPSGLKYFGIVTMNDGRKAHQWNKTEHSMGTFTDYFFYFTDIETNLPVFEHSWRTGYRGHMFNVGFENMFSFNITAVKPPESAFNIREGSQWPEKCQDNDLGPPGTFLNPATIYAANTTFDGCFKVQLGDKPMGNVTHVSFSIINKLPFNTPNCTDQNPCVAIRPDCLTFSPENWAPQQVCLHFLRPGISAFIYHISGGGYTYASKDPEQVYTCENLPATGPDACNM